MQSHKKLEFSLLKINGGLILITLLFGPSIPSMTPNSLELLIMNFAKSLSGKFGFESLFDFDEFRKESILKGLDDIGITLRFEEDIKRYEINDTKIN